ncbi:MXAN_6640 family putative metalloprotease [Nocardioides silvaticus]|uniref:MXAN_6640 family putative metalloprotease n=1 Tax=Nocardioides silvaticus TaxID=2201891 RepID=UPI0011B26E01|nr:MXAN_6640 family putative metalloprotease [Nocardioides silvaticus]
MLKSKSLLTIPIALALGLTLAGPTAVADDDFGGPGLTLDATSSKADAAADTLDEVQAILDGDAVGRGGRTTDGRSLTVALRDLKRDMKYLKGEDNKQAQRFLMRPGEGGDPYIPGALPWSTCGPQICVHYTESGANAPDGSDGVQGTIPQYVTDVLNTIEQINTDYIAAGYRTPERDGALGGSNNKVDIYLGDIGPQGLYGFCTSDDPHDPFDESDPGYQDFSFWAYCALDNDYDSSEFPTNTPFENMQVTAAHEFFHAVQYAYDAYEDGWIIESTATWVEDEMFDDVNDNRNYLGTGPLAFPNVPIDYYGSGDPEELSGFHYGTWIWWRYLTEKFPAKTGKLPKLVLDVWKRLDAANGAGPDRYSTQGLADVLKNRGTNISAEIIKFQVGNRRAKSFYDEGNAYTPAPAAAIIGLAANRAAYAEGPINHMASATARFNPKNLSQKAWKLRLTFDLPPKARGAAAVVVVYRKNGKIDQTTVKLDKKGNATKTVPFSSKTVKGVDAVLVNTSTRFTCWASNESPYSCFGNPKDDGLKYKVTGRTVK